jgi:Asp-tRNA(Asn)/Glu-tRNA(Gln) amidotransferase A subunit family amidase
MSSIVNLSARSIASMVRKKDISAAEVAREFMTRISALDKHLHAWAFVSPELSLKYAKSIDENTRDRSSDLLLGVPMGIKDIFNTQDMPTCMGSPIWEGFMPGNDARVVHSLNMAGGVVLGKTVTAEFAVHAPGPTKNPHNFEFAPGTSSSGSAAAVSARMVPVSIGTQTAGSIIRPSSYCGVYAMKPSFGLIPRTGTLKTTDTLDSVGFFSHSLEDLTLLFDVCRVKGEDFPISHKVLSDPKRQNREPNRPWRVGLIRGPKWTSAESYARTALEEFAKKIAADPDIDLTEIKGPDSLTQAHDVHATIYDRTLAYYFREEFLKHTLVSKIMYEIITRGNKLSLEDYRQALSKQTQIASDLDNFIANDFDIILDLSTGGEALRGLESTDRLDNCLIWTLAGVPTINLPVFKGPNDLPFGAQILARRYEDYKVLAFANHLASRNLLEEAPMPSLTGKAR